MEAFKCIFCHSVLQSEEQEMMENFVVHLDSHHQIKFNMDHVIRLSSSILELEQNTQAAEMPDDKTIINLDFEEEEETEDSISSMDATPTSLNYDIKSPDAPLDLSKSPVGNFSNGIECISLGEDDDIDEDIYEGKNSEEVSFMQGTLESMSKKRDYASTFSNDMDTADTIWPTKTPRLSNLENEDASSQMVTDPNIKMENEIEKVLKQEPIIKLEVDFLEPMQIKEDDSDILSNDQEIPWYHGTLYSCQFCTKQYFDRSPFKQHVESSHNMTYEEYQGEHEDASSHGEKHECEICGYGVSWNKSAIEKHLLTNHNTNLEEYYGEFKEDIEHPDHNITDNTLLSRYRDRGMTNSNVENGESNSSWANRCIYKCNLCEKIINSKYDFEKHVQMTHSITPGEYSKLYGKTVVHEEKHHCQVEHCKSQILWDKTCINSHLRLLHDSMPLHHYQQMYMKNYSPAPLPNGSQSNAESDNWANKCIFKCALCESEFPSKRRFGAHLRKMYDLSIKEYVNDHGRSILHEETHSCQVESCDVSMIWDKTAISNHLRNVHENMALEDYKEKYMGNYVKKEMINAILNVSNNTNHQYSWANRCIYKCILCEMIFKNSKASFEKHMPRVHDITLSEYIKKYGKTVEHEEKHCCQVESCNSTFAWERGSLSGHLRLFHNSMSLQEYEAKYMSNYKDKDSKNVSFNSCGYDDTWANKCIFKCSLCGMTFNKGRQFFERHFPSIHNITIADYTKEHGKSMEYEEKHFCQVENCNSKLTWEKGCIKAHLRLIHDSMTLQDYEIKYMSNYAEKIKETNNLSSTSSNSSDSSSWANRCIYKCNICGMIFKKERQFFERHFPAVHNMTIGDYTKEHGKTMEYEEKHFCQVENCNSKITWDKGCIKGHLRLIHESMSLQDYEIKYMSNYTESKQVLPSSTSSTYSWANKCIFKCVLCEIDFNSKRSFEYHLKAKHDLVIKEYTLKYGKTMTCKEMHSCQVEDCKSYILWDKQIIYHHLKSIHEISLDEYEEKYMGDYKEKEKGSKKIRKISSGESSSWANRCIYKCNICGMTFKQQSRQIFERHVPTAHNIAMGDYTKEHGKSMEYEEKHVCQVENCNSKLTWERSCIKAHLKMIHESMTLQDYEIKYMSNYEEKETKHVTSIESSSWANRCSYKCNICGMTFTKQPRQILERHVTTAHNIAMGDYTKEHGKSMEYEEKHVCQVENCNSKLTWERSCIKAHLKMIHDSMSLQDYEIKYMKDYKEKDIKPIIKDVNVDYEWANKCTFKCALCSKEFESRYLFGYHLKSQHYLKLKEYTNKHGKSISIEKSHSCQVKSCDASISWDKAYILNHLRSSHESMHLEDYKVKYMDNYVEKQNSKSRQELQDRYGECQFSCNICKPRSVFHSRSKAGRHMIRFHKTNLKDYKELHGSSMTYKINHICHICAAVLLWDKSAIVSHLHTSHDKIAIEEYFNKYIDNFKEGNDWFNKTNFKCKECKENKFSTNNRQELWEHVKNNHKMKELEYRNIHGSIYGPEFPVFHTCQVCSQRFNWESISLKPHIEIKHAMSLEEYADKYKDSYTRKPNNGQEPKEHDNSLRPSSVAWANKCTFTCALCNVERRSRNLFGRHLKSQHYLTLTEYTKSHGKSISHEEVHSCQIESCGSFLTWDSSSIKNHLVGVHDNLSMEDYKAKYMDNYVKREGGKVEKSVNADYEWANKCTFKCDLCGKEFESRTNFGYHLKTQHYLKLKEYTVNHGKSLLLEKRHSCQVESCDASMSWDKTYILNHLRSSHENMHMEDYKVKYMDNYVEKQHTQNSSSNSSNTSPIYQASWANRCIYKCIICGMTFGDSRRQFETHIPKEHFISAGDYTKQYGKTMDHEEKHSCQVEGCSSKITWEKSYINSHLRSVHNAMSLQDYEIKYMSNYKEKETQSENHQSVNPVPFAWANRCIFKCSMCQETFNAKSSFDYHLKTKHELSVKDYTEQFGKTMAHEEKHSCQVEGCSSNIWWDKSAIFYHLRDMHDKMSLEEYEKTYMSGYIKTENGKPNDYGGGQDKFSECQFSCNICKPEKLFNSRTKAGHHMKSAHNTNLKDYKNQYGHGSLIYKINHICQICSAVVLWDKSAIRGHLYTVHENMPIEEYFGNYMDNFTYENEWLDKITLRCKECKDNQFSTNSRQELWKHSSYVHNLSDVEYRTIHGSIYFPELPVMHTCQICFQRLNWESISLKPHVELKHGVPVDQYVEQYSSLYAENYETFENSGKSQNLSVEPEEDPEALKWTVGTLYLCKICQNEIPGIYQFKKHLEMEHDTKYGDYDKNYDSKEFVKFSGFHICNVCNKNVKHDYQALKNHMKEHGLTITQYFHSHNPKPSKLAKRISNMF